MEKYNGLIIGVALIVSSVIIYFGLVEGLSQNRYEVFASEQSSQKLMLGAGEITAYMIDKKRGEITACTKISGIPVGNCERYFELRAFPTYKEQ